MTYVIVEQCGHADERIVAEERTFNLAYREMNRRYDVDELDTLHVEIMKRLPDGSLSTEY